MATNLQDPNLISEATIGYTKLDKNGTVTEVVVPNLGGLP